MNQHFRLPSGPAARPTTQAAEGLPRWQWTVAELDRMLEAGILGEDDQVELIGGELVPMSPKGTRHDDVRHRLLDLLYSQRTPAFTIASEPGWRASAVEYYEPDLLVFPTGLSLRDVTPADVLLLVEVADPSLSIDLRIKGPKYAGLGVREYWVIDVNKLVIHVHLAPEGNRYTQTRRFARDQSITPSLLPGINVVLADILPDWMLPVGARKRRRKAP